MEHALIILLLSSITSGSAFILPVRATHFGVGKSSRCRATKAQQQQEEEFPLSTLVSLRGVTLSAGARMLVKDLDLDIQTGDNLAILGLNGSGKSTLALKIVDDMISSGLLGSDKDASSASSVQRRELSRGELALGFHELPAVSTENVPSNTSPLSLRDTSRIATFISFESHRKLLNDEAVEFHESRFTVVHKRATPASFLFPELYPIDPEHPDGYRGYRPKRTRLAPLPVPYDATGMDPLLARLEDAVTTGNVGRLLKQFGLHELRHNPIHGLSTGEARKLMVMDALLSASPLVVLDEAFEGLDETSRKVIGQEIKVALDAHPDLTLLQIAHREEDIAAIQPRHVLLIGQGPSQIDYKFGNWDDMLEDTTALFVSQKRSLDEDVSLLPPSTAPKDRVATSVGSTPVIEFRDVTIKYGDKLVLDSLSWTVQPGSNWIIQGGNGAGKSTLLDLITGENPRAFGQDITLFGRRKGSGESIWDIKRNLGVISPQFHMAYNDFTDNRIRGSGSNGVKVTSFEVVCSGFFDSVGLYEKPSLKQEQVAWEWIVKFGLEDLIAFPGGTTSKSSTSASPSQKFFDLSHGQQKLVLLCRAMVKRPLVLLLDEPTHGLSGRNRQRLLGMLRTLADDLEVAVVYITHRQDEVNALAFDNFLQLKRN